MHAGWIVGTPEECRARIRAYAETGLDSIILSFLEDVADPYQVAKDLAPGAVFGA